MDIHKARLQVIIINVNCVLEAGDASSAKAGRHHRGKATVQGAGEVGANLVKGPAGRLVVFPHFRARTRKRACSVLEVRLQVNF